MPPGNYFALVVVQIQSMLRDSTTLLCHEVSRTELRMQVESFGGCTQQFGKIRVNTSLKGSRYIQGLFGIY